MAHLSRLFRATARPAVTASASEAAPTTSIVIIFSAPSASSWSCRARSAHTSVSARMNSFFSGDTPAAPLAISSTVSLVDMQPSVSSRSKFTAVAERSAASSSAGARSASVVSTHNMVASPGASIPAPLAIPPMVQRAEGVGGERFPPRSGGGWGGRPPEETERRKAIFTTVSVVLIASAAARPPAREASATAASTPGSSLSIGNRSPIRPVEQTAISPAPTSIAVAKFSAVACVSWKPSGPVQALAPPELSTTARTRPPLTTWRVQVTGAACTRLVVNTAAVYHEGPSFRTTATSGWPDCFSPATTPAARKPSGAVTLIRIAATRLRLSGRGGNAAPPPLECQYEVISSCCPQEPGGHLYYLVQNRGRACRGCAGRLPGCRAGEPRTDSATAGRGWDPRPSSRWWMSRGHSVCGQAGRLWQAEHEVGDLDGLAGRTLDQVVQGADDDGAAGVPVGRHLQVGGVGAEGGASDRPPALGQHVHEGFPVVSLAEHLPQLASRCARPRGAGSQDAAGHRGQRRGERDSHRRRGGQPTPFGINVLLYFRRVPVGAADLVRGHRPQDLGGKQLGPQRTTGAGRARGGHDHDVGRLGQAGGQQRRQREDRGGSVAAGRGHRGGRPDRVPGTG